ncbi:MULTISPECIES: YggS family pyridoxal phosphate-dependent enzyme [Methylosinus]|uniref:Pyridoxal phosphate homeostasis protein n=1 Tax=Methylosinus trichosporium (strain ATCC 35070 / NCIMB 11131 / UNIQEM 75 / OB3b) TaxID=595536 RepID=A0A2D2CZW3_METT3|nr:MULTISPECIES: YggS family pyridoxal phosphate-dependent enzyme [Methylosinus]ATQ68262.1 YggS family pyridoxal phosphate-dependent enzyme [Methylosinus trichosporium OB3b]OBS54438.1 YggS family pyridoxal phosphate enzyme [Methylosinus sp. 3S-1]
MTIVDRLKAAEHAIAERARDCGRDPAEITLVCVSKTFPGEAVIPLLEAGHRVFGENKVQEARAKWGPLRERFPVELHLIGPLQSNKAREAVETFDVIESVDRPKIAEAIAAEIARQGRRPRLLVQVNTGEEPQKAGVRPQEADAFIKQCREQFGLEIAGLMCVPPVDQQASPHFALLAAIARRNGLKDLSMGMSADYELAIQLGATHVRIGSAIMGERDYSKG